MPTVPVAPTTSRTREQPRGRPGWIATICIACGLVTVGIQEYWFPSACQQFLRDWGMHWIAVMATTLGVGLVLGVPNDDSADPFRYRLAVRVPFVCLLLHELGQWTWPDGPRDHFDSLRDVGLNVIGSWLGACLLRWGRPRSAQDARISGAFPA